MVGDGRLRHALRCLGSFYLVKTRWTDSIRHCITGVMESSGASEKEEQEGGA